MMTIATELQLLTGSAHSESLKKKTEDKAWPDSTQSVQGAGQ